MRVLYLLKTAVGGDWARREIRELTRLGVEAHVVTPDGPLVGEYEKFATHYTHQFDFPKSRPHRFAAVRRELRSLVAVVRPDLIHSFFVGTTVSMRLALGRHHPIPRVFQVPGPLHLEHAPTRLMEIKTAGRNDFWIAGCRSIRDSYIAAGIAAERVTVGNLGVDLDVTRPSVAGKLRAELGINLETPVIGMVAYMYPPRPFLGSRRGIKGHEDLIDAIAICKKKRPEIRVVFVGGAWEGANAYERRLHRHASRVLGDTAIFLGSRVDVPDLYADFDCVVHPSLSESLGGAATSLTLGVPTIATDVGGLPELVINGETGLLVPPRSPIAIAGAIDEMLSSPEKAKAMARKGQRLARDMLDVRKTAKAVFDRSESILSGHDPAARPSPGDPSDRP